MFFENWVLPYKFPPTISFDLYFWEQTLINSKIYQCLDDLAKDLLFYIRLFNYKVPPTISLLLSDKDDQLFYSLEFDCFNY
jgi:hypothetical protein